MPTWSEDCRTTSAGYDMTLYVPNGVVLSGKISFRGDGADRVPGRDDLTSTHQHAPHAPSEPALDLNLHLHGFHHAHHGLIFDHSISRTDQQLEHSPREIRLHHFHPLSDLDWRRCGWGAGLLDVELSENLGLDLPLGLLGPVLLTPQRLDLLAHTCLLYTSPSPRDS
eukprot:TRINITY_DN21878_c0_g1_i1.p1 TRINITY_DN21878_c0_g1~~TRINITY_DN21878_c0_g1_i1.p1  ORF type:complete len:168 (-),score=12.24 TRINITY_DN21878_c0_g1_i1:126-629(-)